MREQALHERPEALIFEIVTVIICIAAGVIIMYLYDKVLKVVSTNAELSQTIVELSERNKELQDRLENDRPENNAAGHADTKNDIPQYSNSVII